MPPKRRRSEASKLAEDVEIIQPSVNVADLETTRVTRGLCGPNAKPRPPPLPKKQKKPTAGPSASTSSPKPKNIDIFIEYCTRDKKFLKVATGVEKGIQTAALQGVNKVVLNPEGKSRAGCFEIRIKIRGGHKFLSHLNMKSPYKALEEIKVDEVVADIAKFLMEAQG